MKRISFATLIVLFFSVLSTFSACSTENHEDILGKWTWDGNEDTTVVTAKPRYIWIDAAANFARFANSKENIEEDLTKVKNAGFTDIIVDVRPTMGDVLFNSSHCPQVTKLDYWTDSGQYQFYERTATWDYLQAFIDIAHKLGLKVTASMNTFVGGNLYAYGLGEQGLVFRDAAKKDWVTTLNMADGPVNEMDLTTIDPSDAAFYGTKFLNPVNKDVQDYLISIISDLAQYNVDGICLDRCRFDNLTSDVSDYTQQKFKEYLGVSNLDFFTDVIKPGSTTTSENSGKKYFKDWIAFRAKTICDFVKRASETVHAVNKNIKFSTYVGAWYSSYSPESGVNWASSSYDASAAYSWANSDYQKYSYLSSLDQIFLGCYAGTDAVYGDGEWTMQGFAKQGQNLIKGEVPFIGGPDVGNSTGFTQGGQGDAVTKSVDAIINVADGYFVFDLCHVREYDYWDALKKGIDAYLESLSSK